MKKFLIFLGIGIAALIVFKLPDFLHRYKTTAIRAKIHHAKIILNCSKKNPTCITEDTQFVTDVLLACPKVKCFKDDSKEYYNRITRRASVLILEGDLGIGSRDLWIQIDNQQNIHCIDGSGWDKPSTHPQCKNL